MTQPSTSSSSWLTPLKNFWQAVNVPLVAVLLALLIGALLIVYDGANPITAYQALLTGALGDSRAWERTLEKATPLIFSGLAVAFAFKAGLFNIGAQGQLLFGSLVAAVVGFSVELPIFLHIPLALTAGATAGALYGLIPGALKTYTGAHEVITTIMLNYVAINITDYLANEPFRDPSPTNVLARTPKIFETAMIPQIGELVPAGFLIALLMAGLTWWLLWKTTIGYEIRTVGQNPHAAHYAGMKVARTVMLTMFLSGFLSGMGGAVETQGVIERFQPGFNAGLGFDGITVALLAKTDPIGVIPAALLVGMMRSGQSRMQIDSDVDTAIIDVIQALILFFVAAEVIVRWLIRSRTDNIQRTLTGGWGKGS